MDNPPTLQETQTLGRVSLSKYTKALLKSWQMGTPKPSLSPNKISVSQTVSFLAFLYEKMRNAVEFRDEHLIRRAAIERIIRRRITFNENGRDMAESLIKEFLWARYYENNTIGEEKIAQVQAIIDKYFLIRNEVTTGRSQKEKERINSFIIEVLSCEIEETLSSHLREEAFTNFVYQLVRKRIAPFANNEMERDIQVYIAVERSFANSDNPLIRYHLLKLMLPEITSITWKSSDRVLSKFYDVFQEIEKNLKHPLADRLRNFAKKQKPPFLVLQDMFRQNSDNIDDILTDESKLKQKVDEACRKRYEETKSRLRRTGVRSFIYILLTKVVFALLLEIPYDLYIQGSISYLPLGVNILFPPVLMSFIIVSVSVPGDENTKKIYSFIKRIISEDPDAPGNQELATVIDKKDRVRNPIFKAMFTTLYLLTYLVSFGTIIYILSWLGFNPISQGVFIFFVTLVTFFAFKVINITSEYLVIDKEGPFSIISDFFFLPIIKVGQWLSGEVLTRFNVLMFVFDFIIEMPLKAIVEVVDEWVRFVRLKKEEMV